MCYAIPGRVESIKGKRVTVEYFGEKKTALNELIDLAPGDYIYAQGGFVIQRIPAAEAESVLDLWREIFFQLQEVDVRLSRLDSKRDGVDPGTGRILDRALARKALSREELVHILSRDDAVSRGMIFNTANFLRQKYHGNSCCVHGILEISNICARNCSYCGISLHNRGLSRYRMSREEILRCVEEAVDRHGFKALVLQSGEAAGYDIRELQDILREIRRRHAVLLFVSFGEMEKDDLQRLYDAGARGILLRFETSNPRIYEQLHPGYAPDSRLRTLRDAYETGYLILTGALVGLPGQTVEDLADDILLARELHAEMYSFGPFLPHPETPLASHPAPDETLVLKVLAAVRLLDAEKGKILVTTGLETLHAGARRNGLLAGANTVMLNVTPREYRKLYSIYPGRAHQEESVRTQISDTIRLLRDLGRAPTDLGVS